MANCVCCGKSLKGMQEVVERLRAKYPKDFVWRGTIQELELDIRAAWPERIQSVKVAIYTGQELPNNDKPPADKKYFYVTIRLDGKDEKGDYHGIVCLFNRGSGH